MDILEIKNRVGTLMREVQKFPDGTELSVSVEVLKSMTRAIREYENCITWNVNCVMCARLLDMNYQLAATIGDRLKAIENKLNEMDEPTEESIA